MLAVASPVGAGDGTGQVSKRGDILAKEIAPKDVDTDSEFDLWGLSYWTSTGQLNDI